MKHQVMCLTAALFLAVGFLLCVCLPKQEYSLSERRLLAKAPPITKASMVSGRFAKEWEAYASDTFPFREQLRRLWAWTAGNVFRRKDRNGLYLAEGHFVSMEYPLRESSLDQAARRLEEVYQRYRAKDSRAWLAVIPDKNCFLAKQSGHLSMDYEEFERLMQQKVSFAEYIRISDLLNQDDYYRTDPHWRQENIVDVAKRLTQRMGVPANWDYTVHTMDVDFYGAYYGQAAQDAQPDVMRYLTADVMDGYVVYDWQNRREIPMYDLEKAAGRDAYELFLSGPLSLITMENKEIANHKHLVIFRDSFGSSLAPLLLGGYAKITLADLRYMRPELLEKEIDFEGCDFLFLYSTLVLNHSEKF